MSEKAGRLDVFRQSLQVLIVPCWSETSKNARPWSDIVRVPTNAEAVAIEWLLAFFGLETLKDQRVLRTV